MNRTDFTYTITVRAAPERVWDALTMPHFIERYFSGGHPKSTWRPGAPVLWTVGADHNYKDWGQRVLEADPPRRLAYTWYNYEPEIRSWFGCTDEEFAKMREEPISTVRFDVEPVGSETRLTLAHAGFAPDSAMLAGVSQGWPAHLSALKAILDADQAWSLAKTAPGIDSHINRSTTLETDRFVYTIYITSTPDRVWEALTKTEFIEQYFGGGPKSSWQTGAPVLWRIDMEHDYADWGQRVLEADPPRRLSYTWQNYEPEMRKYFDWSDEQFAELRKEPISKVTFELEPVGDQVRLTLIHDDLVAGSEMIKGVSQGWPMIISNLKTFVERA